VDVVPIARVWLVAALTAIVTAGGPGWSAAQEPVATPSPQAAPARTFDEWLAAFRTEAASRGVSAGTIERALGSVSLTPVVVERDRTQAELTLTLDQYLARRLPASFVRTARKEAKRQRRLLRDVEAAYGVPGSVVAAVWGLESNFGRFAGVRPTIATLATLAYDGRRASLFREELVAALTIIDRGDVPIDELRGSWAGAMGQPQFMPSTFLSDAVDFDRDGRKDIWRSVPDALGSIGRYLQAHGWVRGQRWGREVVISQRAAIQVMSIPLRLTGPCQAVRAMSEPRRLATWKAMGIRLKGGGGLPLQDVQASLVELDGRAFLVYPSYEALLAYNCAHTYALSVVSLADRIR
jgi:membrane-bound lytic murein transglycosylase B